jgi:dTMP kinase
MLVVFEGIDGSGKTAVAERAMERLAVRGVCVALSSRSILASSPSTSNPATVATAVARDEISPRRPHRIVFTEGSLRTPEVLGYASEALGLDSGTRFNSHLTGPALLKVGLTAVPDLVVLVDADPALARARKVSNTRALRISDGDSAVELALSLQYRLRRGYLRLARAEPERWAVVDNEGPLAVTVSRVCSLIEQALELGVWQALVAFRDTSAVARRPPELRARNVCAALEQVLGWVNRRSVNEPGVAAYWLSGWHGVQVDALRRSLAARVPLVTLEGVRGLADDVSHEIREGLAADHAQAVALSLLGLSGADRRVAHLRAELVSVAAPAVATSLEGCDDADSWGLRERLYEAHPDRVMASLAYLSSNRAWQLRERWLSERGAGLREDEASCRVAARSVTGVSGERAWFVRITTGKKARLAMLRSTAGLIDEQSWELREQEIARAPLAVLQTFAGVAHVRAWRLRAAVAPACKQALDGIVGMSAQEAWELRDEYRDLWPSTVLKSLGVLAMTPRGEALAERQLAMHGSNASVLRHAAAIALGMHREPSAVRVRQLRREGNLPRSRKMTGL